MRIQGLDILRGLSAFLIVGNHLQLESYTASSGLALSYCNLGVGIFAALAGYFMDSSKMMSYKDESTYIVKRAKRLLPVYAIWSVVFLIASAIFQLLVSGCLKGKYFLVSFWIKAIFCGDSSTHLWFIISLLYAQIIFSFVVNFLPRCVWFLVGVVLVSVSQYWHVWFAVYPLRLFAFLVLGWCIRGVEVRSTRFCGFLMAIALLLRQLPIPFFLSHFIIVPPVILFFISLLVENSKCAAFLGLTSMGVFLLHPIFTMSLATIVRHFAIAPYGLCAVGCVWIMSWVLSLMLTKFLLRGRMSWIVR